MATIVAGDTIRVRLTTPNENNRLAVATIMLNDYTTRFRVTTATGLQPQPAGEPLISLFGLPQLNGTSKTNIFGAGTLHRIALQKSPSNPSRAIYVSVMPDEMGGIGYAYPWTLELGTAAGPVNTGEQQNLTHRADLPGAYFTVNSADPGCSNHPRTASVNVLDVAYAPDGTPTRLAMDFVLECDANSINSAAYSRIYGHVRIQSDAPIDYSIKRPIPFVFQGVKDAALNTLYTSALGYAQGITEPVAISIIGGEYSVEGGAFRSDASTIGNGQSVRVRLTSAGTADTLRSAVLTMGGVEFPFRVGTAPGATPQPQGAPMMMIVGIPPTKAQPTVTKYFSSAQMNAFEMNASTSGNKTNSLLVYSTPDITSLSALVAGVSFSGTSGGYLSPGTYQVTTNDSGSPVFYFDHGGYYGSVPGCYGSSDVYARKIVVHEVEYGAGDKVTKLAADLMTECGPWHYADYALVYHTIRYGSTVPVDYSRILPAPFVFEPTLGVAPLSVNVSNSVDIIGINAAVPISIAGGEYSISNGPFTSAPGTVSNDQTLRVRGIAAASAETLIEVKVSVGARNASYKIGTAADPKPQPRANSPLIVMYGQGHNGALTQRVISSANLYSIFSSSAGGNVALLGVKSVSGNSQSVDVSFALSTAGTDLVPGVYLSPASSGGNGNYSFSGNFTAGDLPMCNQYYYPVSEQSFFPGRSKFIVHEIEHSVTGQLLRLAADVVETCAYDAQLVGSAATSAVFSFIRFNSTVSISHAIKQPVPLTFTPALRLAPMAIVESNAAPISGITEPVVLSVAPGNPNLAFSIDGAPFSATPKAVSAGQSIRLRTSAPANANSFAINTINLDDTQATFFVGTEPGLGPNINGNPIIHLISQGEEPIGRGNSFVFSPALRYRVAGLRVINYVTPPTEYLRVEAYGTSNLNYDWAFVFSGPGRSPLVPGTYLGAENNQTEMAPVMSIHARSLYSLGSCSLLGSGSNFTVHEIAYVGDTVHKLAMDFVQYCAGNPDPLYGYIRINSGIPIDLVADGDPSPFAITPVGNVLRSTQVISAPVAIGGFNVAVPISITGGEYSLNGGAFTSAPGIINPGQSFRIRLLSSSNFSAQTTATVSIGARGSNFVVTTAPQDTYPDSLAFPTVEKVQRNTLVTSQVVTVNDINDAVTVGAGSSNIEFSIAGAPFTTSSSQLQPGQSLQLRMKSAPTHSTLTTGSLIVGGKLVTFTIRTGAQAIVVASIVGAGNLTLSPMNLTCTASCSTLLDQGTAITLTANAARGAIFVGWSGAGCSGAGTCNITVDLTASVTATFAPAPPTIVQTVPGNGSALFRMLPPAIDSGVPVSGYTVTCLPGSVSASANATLITVTGLANDTAYTCSATASTTAGSSLASNAVMVTPNAAILFALNGVKSRKTHGANQVHEIDVDPSIPQAGVITVEPRAAGAGHQIVFQFNAALGSVASVVAADEANNSIVIADQSMSGNELRVTLSGALDKKRIKISLTGVNGALDASASIGFLLGDVGMAREVTQAAASAIKSRTGQAVSLDNFIYDINLSGTITAADVVAVRRRVGNKLP